ncbi:hypothetical protein B0H11DRAFT_1911844 [Mycena galericulata]|nr:hypothetical protein B0H11DRAFT_1911844 [Mycena galericulata]
MSATSRAGVLLPLPASFDLVAYSTRPNDIPAPSGMELDDKNAENCVIETHNKASILLTRAYARAKETSAGVGALDVGLPLKAMWAYTDEEKASLLHFHRDLSRGRGGGEGEGPFGERGREGQI